MGVSGMTLHYKDAAPLPPRGSRNGHTTQQSGTLTVVLAYLDVLQAEVVGIGLVVEALQRALDDLFSKKDKWERLNICSIDISFGMVKFSAASERRRGGVWRTLRALLPGCASTLLYSTPGAVNALPLYTRIDTTPEAPVLTKSWEDHEFGSGVCTFYCFSCGLSMS